MRSLRFGPALPFFSSDSVPLTRLFTGCLRSDHKKRPSGEEGLQAGSSSRRSINWELIETRNLYSKQICHHKPIKKVLPGLIVAVLWRSAPLARLSNWRARILPLRRSDVQGCKSKLSFGKVQRGWYEYGGGGEIRTLGRLSPSLVFKTSAFNRSATPPRQGQNLTLKLTPVQWTSSEYSTSLFGRCNGREKH